MLSLSESQEIAVANGRFFTVDVYRKCVKLSHVLKSGQLFQQRLSASSAAKHSQDDTVLRFPFVLELNTLYI